MPLPFLHLDLPVKSLLNPKFVADNMRQDYFTQIYRFADAEKHQTATRAIPGRHTVQNEVIFCTIDQVLSDEFVAWLRSLDLTGPRQHEGSLFMFYHKPQGRPGPIHCDWGPHANESKHHWAINWTTCTSQDQKMMWYTPRSDQLDDTGFPIEATKMNAWSRIPEFAPETVITIAETAITAPTLVRTDIAHNAQNYALEPRWCFSYRGRGAASWEEAVSWFNPFAAP